MAKQVDSWGLEIGSNAIKAIHLSRAGTAEPELVEYDIIPFDQILTTPEVDVEAAVHEKLDLFLSRHDLSDSELVVSVQGHRAFARFAKLPPVEAKKVPDVVKFEAQQQIPFPIEQVEWDYQVFQHGQANQLGVGIFAMNKERVGQTLNQYEQFGLEISALTLSPLAVYNAFQYDNVNEESEGGTIYMDIGAMSTDVIIVEDGGIWLRTLPIGGNHFTEALVRAFKLSYPKAEKLKREAGTSKYARQIFQAMRPVFADLVQEIQRSLGYYQSLYRESNLTKLIGVGSTFRLPGLRKFLKQQLQIEVERLSGFKRINVEGKQESDFAAQSLNLATAYGLALQGLGMETVTANLLPMHTLQARLWQKKQPWFVAGAAGVALAALIGVGSMLLFSTSWNGLSNETDQLVSRVVNPAEDYQREWQQIDLATPRMQINNLRRLVDYRDLQPGLVRDLTGASQAVLEQTDGEVSEVYIASARSLYEPDPGASDDGDGGGGSRRAPRARGRAGPRAGAGGGTGFGSGRQSGGSSLGEGDNPFGENVDPEQYFSEEGPGPPQFVITIKGTTAVANAGTVLQNVFNGALQSLPQEQKRPYRTKTVQLASLSDPYEPADQRVTENTTTGRAGGRGQGTAGRRRGAAARGTTGSASGEGSGDTGERLTSEIGELDQYFPTAEPYNGADRVQDFTIRWKIELLSPAGARRGEPGGQQPEQEQGEPAGPQRAGERSPGEQAASSNTGGEVSS